VTLLWALVRIIAPHGADRKRRRVVAVSGIPGRFTRRPRPGAITLIQRFGSAPNLNDYFHMLFLDGLYVERPDGSLRFRWVKAPTSAELAGLT